MSNSLLLAVAVSYVYVSIDYILKKNYGMSLAFFAYAVANIGFIWTNLKGLQ